eukprot:CAMPEP_0201278444 /NCGR_PEP_ID=MMETSP0853-20130426/60139_1 /ASSEMBLY_ACC=CAM_ASM_000640 /TAXON_ID=183588 /ORGANISM="Pseudo-nitzschia fraudulenta, Strain WWA7" /LENGTH=430 /DNA_ID=CAMNT_0047586765 /DNA_START=827 /DNA_END=2119 /DNA_ORIENTATION=+
MVCHDFLSARGLAMFFSHYFAQNTGLLEFEGLLGVGARAAEIADRRAGIHRPRARTIAFLRAPLRWILAYPLAALFTDNKVVVVQAAGAVRGREGGLGRGSNRRFLRETRFGAGPPAMALAGWLCALWTRAHRVSRFLETQTQPSLSLSFNRKFASSTQTPVEIDVGVPVGAPNGNADGGTEDTVPEPEDVGTNDGGTVGTVTEDGGTEEVVGTEDGDTKEVVGTEDGDTKAVGTGDAEGAEEAVGTEEGDSEEVGTEDTVPEPEDVGTNDGGTVGAVTKDGGTEEVGTEDGDTKEVVGTEDGDTKEVVGTEDGDTKEVVGTEDGDTKEVVGTEDGDTKAVGTGDAEGAEEAVGTEEGDSEDVGTEEVVGTEDGSVEGGFDDAATTEDDLVVFERPLTDQAGISTSNSRGRFSLVGCRASPDQKTQGGYD